MYVHAYMYLDRRCFFLRSYNVVRSHSAVSPCSSKFLYLATVGQTLSTFGRRRKFPTSRTRPRADADATLQPLNLT